MRYSLAGSFILVFSSILIAQDSEQKPVDLGDIAKTLTGKAEAIRDAQANKNTALVRQIEKERKEFGAKIKGQLAQGEGTVIRVNGGGGKRGPSAFVELQIADTNGKNRPTIRAIAKDPSDKKLLDMKAGDKIAVRGEVSISASGSISLTSAVFADPKPKVDK